MPTTPDDHAVASTAKPRRRRLLILLSSITVVVLVLDQLSKVWALANVDADGRRELIGDLLGLQLVFNSGAALSIATGQTWLLTVVAVAVIVFIVRASRRIGSRGWAVALGLLLGGALGNLVDRLFRQPAFGRGEVVDFIAYWNVFVGNVADIAIVVAAVMIVVLAVMGVHIDGTRDARAGDEPTEGQTDGHDESDEVRGTAENSLHDESGELAETHGALGAAEAEPSEGTSNTSEQNA